MSDQLKALSPLARDSIAKLTPAQLGSLIQNLRRQLREVERFATKQRKPAPTDCFIDSTIWRMN